MVQNKEERLPTRRCTGCGEHFPKKTLVRILRTPEGEIVLDKLGKSSGRGAYICKSSSCLRKAIKSRRIDASLKTKIPEEIYLRLEEEIKE